MQHVEMSVWASLFDLLCKQDDSSKYVSKFLGQIISFV